MDFSTDKLYLYNDTVIEEPYDYKFHKNKRSLEN